MAVRTVWNFTLNDTSPLFRYSPLDELNPYTGWQAVYNNSTSLSYHFTRTPNASVSFSFFGTGITLFGTSNTSYVTYFDNEKASTNLSSFEGDVLFSTADVALRQHDVVLQVLSRSGTQVLQFSKAVVNSQVVGMRRSPEIGHHGSDTKAMKTHGSWHTKNSSNRFPLNFHSNISVRATSSPGDSISFSFQGRAIAIYGPVNSSSGLFSVTHDDAVHLVNASSLIPIDETLIFYKDGLKENGNTTFTLTNLGVGQTSFCMSRAEVFAFNSTSATSSAWISSPARDNHRKLLIGAIVGLLVGVVLIVAAVCGIVVMRRRRGRGTALVTINPFETSNEGFNSSIFRKDSKNSETPPEPKLDELPPNPPALGTAERPLNSPIHLPTVERFLFLIASQMDPVERSDEASTERDSSLPPYSVSVRGSSFVSVH